MGAAPTGFLSSRTAPLEKNFSARVVSGTSQANIQEKRFDGCVRGHLYTLDNK